MKKKLFDVEYKKQAVQLCKEEGKTIAQTEIELGILYKILYRWNKEYNENKGTSFVRSGNSKPENKEVIELKRRNRERSHSAINYVSPIQFENIFYNKQKQKQKLAS
ncbi:transposase (plasmid) [Bacillus mycoides]|nr:transposase [Bacillus mycoides]